MYMEIKAPVDFPHQKGTYMYVDLVL